MKKRMVLMLCGVVAAGMVSPVSATVITALGVDGDGGPTWRSTSDAKLAAFDPNADNAYGSSGYYCSVRDSGDIGNATVIQSLPAFIASVTVSYSPTPDTYNNVSLPYASPWYGKLDDPRLAIAPAVADMASHGIWSGGYTGKVKFFYVTLAQNVTFVLTTILNTHDGYAGQPHYSTEGVRVQTPDGGILADVSVAGYGLNTAADYAFFELSGRAGQVFEVRLDGLGADWNALCTSSGLGFEFVGEYSTPEPATLLILGLGLGGMLFRRTTARGARSF